jgi:hypothetical protein
MTETQKHEYIFIGILLGIFLIAFVIWSLNKSYPDKKTLEECLNICGEEKQENFDKCMGWCTEEDNKFIR